MKRSLLLKLGYNGYSFMGDLLIGDLLVTQISSQVVSIRSVDRSVCMFLSISCILVIPDWEPALKMKLSSRPAQVWINHDGLSWF